MKKEIKSNNELAKWIFQEMYWLDKMKIQKRRWKENMIRRYKETGLSKKFPKGTFRATWKMIRKEKLVRVGKYCKKRKFRKKREKL